MNEDFFTGILREISNVIGIPNTLKLVRQYGGTRIYLPKQLSSDHELVAAIGQAMAQKMYKHFGAIGTIEIPKARTLTIAQRNHQIKKEKQSSTRKILAQKYSLTERQITNILHQESQINSDQLSLF